MSEYDLSPNACALRLLRLRMKRNRVRRSKIRTSPPITPPTIAPVGLVVVEELVELWDGTPEEMLSPVWVGALLEYVEEDGAF